MRYFVTGATGFIGGHLVRELVARGHEVVTIARTPAKAGDLEAQGVEVHAGDITDRETMRQPMTGVDGVFHLAAWYKIGAKDWETARFINVDGTRNVLGLMRELQVPKGVYTSTLAVFSDTGGRVPDETYRYGGRYLSHYDRTKAEAHYTVALPMMQAGLPLVIVMPGLVYGKGDPSAAGDMLRQYLQRKLPLVPQKTAFTWAHVDDIVEGHILAMEKGTIGEAYIIAGPVHTLIDALNIAEQATGIPAPRMHAPPALLKGMSALMGAVERVVALPDAYTSEGLRVSAGVTYLGTNAKAKRELGYTPRSLEEGLPDVLRYEMERLHVTPSAR